MSGVRNCLWGGWLLLCACQGPASEEFVEGNLDGPFAAVGAAAGSGFVPNEQLVSPQRDLLDFEFSQARSQFTWCDSTGKLWLGGVDPNTGFFKPANGKALLVDAQAMTATDLQTTFNGPEWTPDSQMIAYTKFLPNAQHVPVTARLAVAEFLQGVWTVRTLPGPTPLSPRLSPYTSEDATDPVQRITYMDHLGTHLWREINDATTEEALPLPPSVKSVRLANGMPAAIFSTPIGGVSQVMLYDLVTKTLSQLTTDAGQKDVQTVPWLWTDPEFGAPVFMTVVDGTELRFYGFAPDAGADLGDAANWSIVHRLVMPESSKIASPQPFVYNGVSYVYFVLTEAPNTFPSTVWLTNMSASAPLLRQLNDGVLRARADPELYVTSKGPYVYYNRYNQNVNPDKPFCADCSEGVFRAFTGLPAPL